MSYCANNCANTNYNNYAGSGGSMLKKKYANKFNKVSANKSFSLNGYNNHNYIGNSNTIIRNDPFSSVSENSCCTNNDGTKNTKGVSFKSVKAYLNSKMSSNNSAMCYKDVNSALVSNPLNKHFRTENRTQSAYIYNVKSKICIDDNTGFEDELKKQQSSVTCKNKVQRNVSSSSRIQYLINCNNLVKDNNVVNGFTPGYDIFYNDSTLFTKKAACNLYNPNDAKVIAC